MGFCVECRFWESETCDDNEGGLAVCLKLTSEGMNNGQLVLIRTRGDFGQECELFKPMTVDNLMGKGN
jgi:hypothetical protein